MLSLISDSNKFLSLETPQTRPPPNREPFTAQCIRIIQLWLTSRTLSSVQTSRSQLKKALKVMSFMLMKRDNSKQNCTSESRTSINPKNLLKKGLLALTSLSFQLWGHVLIIFQRRFIEEIKTSIRHFLTLRKLYPNQRRLLPLR